MINYSLTIVIVTFNSSEIIKQSLENIDCNKYLLIIVYNASTDNTVAVIESNFPSLKIIKILAMAGLIISLYGKLRLNLLYCLMLMQQ